MTVFQTKVRMSLSVDSSIGLLKVLKMGFQAWVTEVQEPSEILCRKLDEV